MNWTSGYTSRWRLFRVDRSTWADGDEVGGLESATIELKDGATDHLLVSGGFTVVAPRGIDVSADVYRLVLHADQGGLVERQEVATLMCECSHRDGERGRIVHELTGNSVLYPASVRSLATGSYAPSGVGCLTWAADLLRSCLIAPVVVDGESEPELSEHVVFDAGTSVLDAVWQVLDACGATMQVDGGGIVHLLMKPSEPKLVLDRAAARLLHPGVGEDLDLSGVPNRVIVERDGSRYEVTNDDPESPTSTVTRGYVHDHYISSPTLVNSETLYGHAVRQLKELSVVQDRRTYSREWWPDVYPGDIVRGSIPSVGLDGDLRVIRQSLDCGHGVKVTEEAAKEIALWARS